MIRSLFLPLEASTILKISLSYNLPEDRLIWVGNKKGIFTVKSAYYIACNLVDTAEGGESLYSDSRSQLSKKIWQ